MNLLDGHSVRVRGRQEEHKARSGGIADEVGGWDTSLGCGWRKDRWKGRMGSSEPFIHVICMILTHFNVCKATESVREKSEPLEKSFRRLISTRL